MMNDPHIPRPRARLIELMKQVQVGGGDTKSHVFFMDAKTEEEIWQQAIDGALGEFVKSDVLRDGVRAVLTTIYGFQVVFGSPELALLPIEKLNLEQLRLVVCAQQRTIEWVKYHHMSRTL